MLKTKSKFVIIHTNRYVKSPLHIIAINICECLFIANYNFGVSTNFIQLVVCHGAINKDSK